MEARSVRKCCLILVLFLAIGGAMEVGSLGRINNINLYVASYRNITGQWVVLMNSTARMVNRNLTEGDKGEDVDVDVQLVLSTGEEMEVVQMYSTATVNIPCNVSADYISIPTMGLYKMHENPLSWFDARQQCISDGADLMVLDSEPSVEIYKKLFFQFRDQIKLKSGYEAIHVGIYDPTESNSFVTVKGDPVNASLWGDHQPIGEGYYCCYADGFAALSNYNCSLPLAYICERPD